MNKQNQDSEKKNTLPNKVVKKDRSLRKNPRSKPAAKNPKKKSIERKSLPVVGIGASAGGLKAIRELLDSLPSDTGMAFVLIQHLNPMHVSSLPEILAKATKMVVQTAEDGQALQPNTLSIIPPGFSLTLEGHSLHLDEREEPPGAFLPIDRFFISMAHEIKDQAIAVVLSGSSSDGAKGVIEIRSAGGLTMAQSEESAEYSSMPRQALLTNKVDFCGSAGEIGRLLGDIARHPHLYPDALPESHITEIEKDSELEPIQALLRKTGVDFSNYKQSTVKRRIMRRMALNRVQTIKDYAIRLKDSPGEIESLKEDLLIKVTSFFRDKDVFVALKKKVYPVLFKGRDHDNPVRIWVPGCASGEEVYSMAISLLEYLGGRASGVTIQIFGTDLSDIAIEKARRGLYSESDLAEVDPKRVDKFFSKNTDGFRINKIVRDMCVFARQDFTRDPPFSRLDLISCRNVLIYLGPILQKRVIPMFHYALQTGGFLLLGQAESIGQFDAMFSLVDSKARIYCKKSGDEHADSGFWPGPPLRNIALHGRTQQLNKPASETGQEPDLEREVEQVLLRKYNPAAVVVDQDLKICHFRGNTGPYLQPVSGKASLDLMKMVRDPLRLELQNLIHLAFKDGVSQCREGLPLGLPEGDRLVRLEVVPFSFKGEQQFFLIEFHDRPTLTQEKKKSGGEPLPHAFQQELSRLQQDLAASYAYQQTLTEEKERALEELRTANEEVLSSNEELQSINEELETAKEELESSNEELSTVNQELQDRNEELTRSNEDLSNLISSAEIPFIIITKELTIRRISPTSGEYLNVRNGDIGRPLSEINLSFKLPKLDSFLRKVMETGQPLEQELRDAGGDWKLLRIRPYKTDKEGIDGAVLSLIDIDRLKQSMAEVERAYHYALGIVEAVKLPLLVLDSKFRVKTANPAFYQKFQVSPPETVGKKIFDLGMGQWNNPELKQLLEEILPESQLIDDFLVKFDFPVLGERSMLVSARPMIAQDSRILLSIQDITERLALENSLRSAKQKAEAASQAKSQFLANMSHEIRTPMTTVIGVLDYLQDANLNESQAQCLDLAEKASNTLLELIGDILDYSKIEARKLTLENRPFNIRDCIEETVAILRSSAHSKNLSLKLQLADEVQAVVYGDQLRLRQVLTNLVGNAIKFTDVGSVEVRIELTAEKNKGISQELLFSIKDSGCGIPANKMELLFESFSQVDASTTRRYGGSGLGLSICKGIVEKMGGKIWVESEEGLGSTFFFTMPIEPARQTSPNPQSSKSTGKDKKLGSKPRILLVEDDASIQQLMRITLDTKEWDLMIVSDGHEAIASWEKGAFNLILMDVQMSGMDGLTAAREIRRREPKGSHTLIMALTAHAHEQARKECLEAGMDDILIKPLRLENLKDIVNKYLIQHIEQPTKQ